VSPLSLSLLPPLVRWNRVIEARAVVDVVVLHVWLGTEAVTLVADGLAVGGIESRTDPRVVRRPPLIWCTAAIRVACGYLRILEVPWHTADAVRRVGVAKGIRRRG